ncbi:hypothetical protein AB0P17_19890 [Streptomyces sp. NPDC088124]|uniref:hypothetical protein n=1 Tax=Streptomyces sp. NPDC088124 TaxID=3154654 RepID=UPI003446CE6B
MKRRTALKAGGGYGIYYAAAQQDTVGRISFDRALPIPPLAESEAGTRGARVFTLGIQSGGTRFKSGSTTALGA